MTNFEVSIRFFLQLAAILAACRFVGYVTRYLGQTQVVGEMIAGVLLGPSLLGWIAPEHRSEILARPMLEAFAHALLQSYASAREPGFRLTQEFQQRVVRWVGTALLISVYGISHYEQHLDERARGVARQAREMLGKPAEWQTLLWGAL